MYPIESYSLDKASARHTFFEEFLVTRRPSWMPVRRKLETRHNKQDSFGGMVEVEKHYSYLFRRGPEGKQ